MFDPPPPHLILRPLQLSTEEYRRWRNLSKYWLWIYRRVTSLNDLIFTKLFYCWVLYSSFYIFVCFYTLAFHWVSLLALCNFTVLSYLCLIFSVLRLTSKIDSRFFIGQHGLLLFEFIFNTEVIKNHVLKSLFQVHHLQSNPLYIKMFQFPFPVP